MPPGNASRVPHAHDIANDSDDRCDQNSPAGAQQNGTQDIDKMLSGIDFGDSNGKRCKRRQGHTDGDQHNRVRHPPGGVQRR